MKMEFPQYETVRETENCWVLKVTFQGKTRYEANFCAEGWKTCDLRDVSKYITETYSAETLEELERMLARKIKMNRFKFRAWRKSENMYYYDAECTYDYISGTPPIPETSFDELLFDDDYIVEQCTGLKDKNGKLIYEGDIVRTVTGAIGYVFFDEYSARFMVKFDDDGEIPWCAISPSQEIIGNIHESEEEK